MTLYKWARMAVQMQNLQQEATTQMQTPKTTTKRIHSAVFIQTLFIVLANEIWRKVIVKIV